jgi:hypothetical protein
MAEDFKHGAHLYIREGSLQNCNNFFWLRAQERFANESHRLVRVDLRELFTSHPNDLR